MKLDQNYESSRYSWATRVLPVLLRDAPRAVVYDVGAGDAEMRDSLEAVNATYRAFDAKEIPGVVSKWNLNEPPDPDWPHADVVLLLDVIEHLPNPALGLQHIADAMLPNAWIILTTPNPRWSRSRIHALRTGFLSCFTENDLNLNHHLFAVWPHVLERLLTEVGLTIEQYCTLDGWTRWPRDLTPRYPLRVGHALLNKIIELYDPTSCGMSYGIVARKIAR